MSENVLPKEQTSTPLMSDLEKGRQDHSLALLTSSEATAAALIVEASDTNVMATSNDDSDTCSLHESDEETLVAAEMRESADAKDEAKDSMADNNKHTAASDDCKSSDYNTMLSAEGPFFHLDNAPGSVSTTVAVTPFKDGKGPPLNGLPVSLPLLSDNVTNTVAVTPMHRSLPPLAPLPLQSQSPLTFPPIPAYSPIPEIVADTDENVSQQQHAGAAAAADTEKQLEQ
ncbi:unnamed protein product [Sphagnum compactum]